MPVIKFVKEKKEIEVPAGANLRAEAVKAGINMNCAINGISEGIDNFTEKVSKVLNCHGFGMCGTCRVKITAGMENTGEMTFREKLKFKYLPVPDPIPVHGLPGQRGHHAAGLHDPSERRYYRGDQAGDERLWREFL